MALQNCSCDRSLCGAARAPSVSLLAFGTGSLPSKWPVKRVSLPQRTATSASSCQSGKQCHFSSVQAFPNQGEALNIDAQHSLCGVRLIRRAIASWPGGVKE